LPNPLAGVFRLQRPDHLAHVFMPAAHVSVIRRYRRFHVVLRHLLRQVSLDDRDFPRAPGLRVRRGRFVVKLDGFLALFLSFSETRRADRHRFQRRLAFAARGDVGGFLMSN